MAQLPVSRLLLFFWSTLLLAALACGVGSNDPTPVPTLAAPEATAVSSTEPAVNNDNEDERVSIDTAVSLAVNRATTMMAQNAKPTPPPSGGLGGKESDGDSVTVAPTLVPPTAVPQRGATGLQIDNSSSTTACFVYVSLPTDETWGADRLDASEVIAAGAGHTLELQPGTYDLRIDDCNGKIIHTEFNTVVDSLWSVQLVNKATPGEGNSPLTVVNDLADATVCYLFISPSSSDSWGLDWLGTGEVVAPDGRAVLQAAEDIYDLKASDCDLEPVAEIYNVTLTSQGYVWALSGATGQAIVEIVNNGSKSVCYVQISLSTAETWGPDWLGSEEVISIGSSRNFEATPDVYDIRALDCDQETLKEEYGLSIQGTLRWAIP